MSPIVSLGWVRIIFSRFRELTESDLTIPPRPERSYDGSHRRDEVGYHARIMAPAIDEVLRGSLLFRRLGPEDRARLAEHARVRSYGKGETIFSEGDPADFFYDITSGRVKIFKMTPTGKDVILEIFGAGDPLGAVAAYHGRPLPASAVALEETTCLLIPRQAFFALIEQHPSLVRGLLLGLTVRLVELTNRLAELTGGRVEARFARFFLKLIDNSGRPDRGGLFVAMPLSRQELADLTGTTIETAIRIMSRWGKQNIVRTEKDGFVVLDREALELLAGER
jgi:CRP-like cAMP-binding protein